MESVLSGFQGRVQLSAAPSTHLHIVNRRRRCNLPIPSATTRPTTSLCSSSSFNPLPLRYSSFDGGDLCDDTTGEKKKDRGNSPTGRGKSSVCHAGTFLSYSANLNWVSVISALALMLTKGTAINKSFLVPLFALLAPPSVISWIKGEYGIWTAFLALIVRLFFFIPGELELPLTALLLVIVSPYQVMDLRGVQSGAIIALALAGYLAFQHFSRIGNFKQSFEQGSLVATLAIVCLTVVSIMLLI